ncbi:ImmA/IrrE family metallo-endopeptidase [Dermatobacter hominis]|uniref:ImmA/IrrE family metallo-endopeptidase n=1 Tax=Dermatobacter hominis TaxID=2884263 RepID=UPI001D120DED|nr:ImmA/IrrE family metallo-endopeptidase [Dermatobacter hominis]UDY34533.1 ImmA/IrrE family metallo-endopeptidase [Dermatobacter hominis]
MTLREVDIDVARSLACEVRSAVVGGFGSRPHAVSLKKVCEAGLFRVVRTSRTGERDAYLVPRSTAGFDVVVRDGAERTRSLARRRLRFALAHEVGHSFFFNRRMVPHDRTCEWTDSEELFCNRFASELLVPSAEVAGLPWTPGSLRLIRDQYDVSLQAAAMSAVAHHPGAVAVALRETDHPTKGRALRIGWKAGEPFVPEHARLGSLVAEAAWVRGTAQGVEELRLGHLNGQLHVEAEREPGSSQVLVLIRPRTQLELGQMELFPRAVSSALR